MKINTEESGQALVELSFVLFILCVIVFGTIEFGRAVYDVQVMKNLAGEGSSMASRGTSPATTATTVITYAGADISLSTKGCVIVTGVTENSAGTAQVVTSQSWAGQCTSAMTLYVTEVFYTYGTITPLPNFLGKAVLPSMLYSAAYY